VKWIAAWVVGLICVAVLAAATHANVQHAGGYQSDGAPLALALTALLAVGIAYAAMSWQDGSRALASLLALCIVAGEAYWLLTNAERELATRDAIEAPLRAAQQGRLDAIKRLRDAEDAKRAADAAAVNEAAKPGCAKNCAALLKDAKDRAERELSDARAVLGALPPERSTSPLAERLGIASWAWDLILAVLRSIGVMGGSVGLALVVHRPKQVSPADDPPPVLSNVAVLPPPLSRYLLETIRKDKGGRLRVAELVDGYREACSAIGAEPPERRKVAAEMARIFKNVGIATSEDAGLVYCNDVRLAR
jgi:hypothetical protein